MGPQPAFILIILPSAFIQFWPLSGIKVKGIRIGTEELTTKEGGKSNVSTIEIVLSK